MQEKTSRRGLLAGAAAATAGLAVMPLAAKAASNSDPVATYAALASLLSAGTVAEGDVIHVTGAGIAGVFNIERDTVGGQVTDNNGTLITGNGGTTSANDLYAERVYDGALNVQWFGAIGDDGISDVSAIQAAIDAAAVQGNCVFFPAGSYLIDSNITAKSKVSLRGCGSGSILKLSGNNRRAFSANSLEDMEFSHLFFEGQKPNVGWQTSGNFDFGIRLGSSSTGQDIKNIRIHHCTFKDIGLDGVYIENFKNLSIYACNFINCRRWGVVPQAGAHDSENFSIEDCYFDCDFGDGPVGKEYPLGAIDSEPAAGEVISGVYYKNLRGKRNTTLIFRASGDTFDSLMESVSVVDGNITVANNTNTSLESCAVRGSLGYLILDTGPDSTGTELTGIDVRFDTGRNPVLLDDSRKNLLPYDFGYEGFFNQGLSIGGSGTSAGFIEQTVDGEKIMLRQHQIGPATGYYINNRHQIQQDVLVDDQVFVYVEFERLDSNTTTGNFISIALGANFARSMKADKGIHGFYFAFKATVNETNPLFTAGLSGTAGAQIEVVFRKLKVFINPKRITLEDLRGDRNPLTQQLTSWTGPSLDIVNTNLALISPNGAQNLDEIADGYDGQRMSIYNSAGSNNLTIRDASVSGSGNIELQNNSTVVLSSASSNTLSVVFHKDSGRWHQGS